MAMSLLPYTYPLALLLVVVAVSPVDPEPGPSVEAINATCATASAQLECSDLLLANLLDVRTPEVKDVIGMSVQVAAKKAAEAAALAKATKNPSKCIAGCIDDLALLTKMIEALPAVLETAENAGVDEFDDSGKNKCGNDCTIDMSKEERTAQMTFVNVEAALHVTDDLLKRRAFFNKKTAT